MPLLPPKRGLDDLASELQAANQLLDNESDTAVWRHRVSGNHYVIFGLSFRESDLVVCVNYCPEADFRVQFHRPLSEWLERYEKVNP